MSLKSTANSLCGAIGAASLALAPALAFGQAAAAPPLPPQVAAEAVAAPAAAPAADDGMQVLEQGPVHEAFAEPVVLEAAARMRVDRAPPEPVNEVPPEVRPEGANVEWISGYWMWSEQQNDFIWVSGVWREIPPGRRWVPGHWAKADAGFAWVSGFWAGEQMQEVNVLPTPPETLEIGPSSPAPAANYFWIPGVWVWQNGGYGWRAGYWYAGQEDWIWTPDHYCYTPQGAIFVNGYWDYPLYDRGLLYAPVYYSSPIYNNAGYFYRPHSIINTALLLTALFANDNYHHYYYGYGGWGNNFYRPWWSNHWGHGHRYDPFYSYHRWHDGRNHDDWHDHVRRDWNRRHDHDWDERGDWGRDGDRDGRDGPRLDDVASQPNRERQVHRDQLVQNVNDFRRTQAGRENSVRLRDLTPQETQAAIARTDNWKQIREARVAAEAKAGAGGAVNLGGNNAAADLARGRARGGDRSGATARMNASGDIAGQVGATGADNGRRLRVDTPEGTPRSSFRLPPVERSAGARAQSGGGVTAGGATADQARRAAARATQNNGFGTQGGGQSQAIERARAQIQQGSGSRIEPRVTYPGRGESGSQPGGGAQFRQGGRSQIQQGGNPSIQGGGRVELPQSTSPGRSFRYNSGNSGGQGQPSFQGGGQPSVRVPSGMEQRSFRVPSGGGGQRSFSVPSGGGGQPTFRSSGGGGPPAFRGNSGGGQPSYRSSGGGGGQPSYRSSGGGGGGQSSFRSGGGGGGQQMNRSSGGGGGNRGGGGGGGGNRGGGSRGRGRN